MPAFQVELTDADTNYSLLALVRALDPDFIDRARHLSIQVDPGVAGTVLVGDANLAADNYGIALGHGEGKIYGDGVTAMASLRTTYARSATAAMLVNIEVRR